MRDKRHTAVKLVVAYAALALRVAVVSPFVQQERFSAEEQAEVDLELYRLNQPEVAGVPVAPLMAIEDAWEIEDTHTETREPLVAWMKNGGAALGFDRETNVFYCTLGCAEGDWPDLELTAGGAEGLCVAFVDDYEWDDVAAAIRAGTAYRLLAWTETEYAYFDLVFTGLPIVTLHVTDYDALSEESDMAARCRIASAAYDAIDLPAKVHLRSGGFPKEYDKWSYRVAFESRTDKGRYKKQATAVLGMEADTDWLLISNASDKQIVRNHMGFDLWNRFYPEGDGIAMLQSRLVEVFVQDQYMGMYQLMQRLDPVKELTRLGADLKTDGVCRLIKPENLGRRPYIDLLKENGFIIEMRQTPADDLDSGLAIFGDFIRLAYARHAQERLTDEEFAALAPKCVDVQQLMEYFLFLQCAGLPLDNVVNNVYIYGVREGDDVVYRFSPWDMDMGFQQLSPLTEDTINEWMVLPERMLNLNLAGTRETLHALFDEKRETILSDDAIYEWFSDMEEAVNATGAYLRDSARWQGEAKTLSLEQYRAFITEHMKTIERYLNESWLPDGWEKKTDI